MDRDKFSTTLTMLKNRRPFGPFTLAMVNGDRLEVDYPDALSLREGLAFYLAAGGVTVWLDHEGVCEIIGGLAGQSPV